MTKEMIMSGDIYWIDIAGNTVVEAPDGEVYLITENDKTVWIAKQISEVVNEEGDYLIDGMDITEYIRRIKDEEETAVPITEAVLQEKQKIHRTEQIETVMPAMEQTVYEVSQPQITENMEVSENELAQSEVTEKISLFTEIREATAAVTAVSENEAAGDETAIPSVQTEAGIVTEISEAEYITEQTEFSTISESNVETSAVTEMTEAVPTANHNAQGFLLLAGVFGAAVAAAVYMTNFRKKKITDGTDLSQLSAKERDAVRMDKQKRKKPKKKKIRKKRIIARTVQKTLPYKCVCDEYIFKVDENKYSKT